MIYTAPRQVLFAVIIIISFFLHTIMLVVNTENEITDSRKQKANRLIAELIDESAVSMSYSDRVSLSVIAKKYAGEYDVTRLIILDNNEEVLMQTGDSPMQSGLTVQKTATYKDSVVGDILLTMKAPNKSEILKDLWLFITGSFLFHLFIWLLYNIVARPTKQQIKMLSNDIHEHYFSHYHKESSINQDNQNTSVIDDFNNDIDNHGNNNKQVKPHNKFLSLITNKINSVKNKTDSVNDIDAETSKPKSMVIEPKPHHQITQDISSFLAQKNALNDDNSDELVDSRKQQSVTQSVHNSLKPAPVKTDLDDDQTAQDKISAKIIVKDTPIDYLQVSICFVDPYGLIDKLSSEISIPYYKLCTQLLNQAHAELFKQTFLQDVQVMDDPVFTSKGADLTLYSKNENQLTLAATVLAELYQILNGILYEKHRELSRFALPVAIGVTIPENTESLSRFLKNFTEAHDIVLLLPKPSLDHLKKSMSFLSLSQPRSVLERECVYVDEVNMTLQKELFKVRNTVLQGKQKNS